MGTFKVKYLETRKLSDGRTGYYWNNRHACALGMENEWLGTDAAAAHARAEYLNRMWDELRRGAKTERIGPTRGTLAWLLDDIMRSDEHRERRAKLQGEVDRAFGIIGTSPLGKARLSDITGRDIQIFHRKLKVEFGVAKAQRTAKWLRAALFTAKRQGLMTVNPMEGLRIERPAARQAYWFPEEVERVIAKAEEMGRTSIGLAIRLAFDTGQREGDVLRMQWSQLAGDEIVVRQNKTGATVRMPCLPELLVALRATAKTSTHLVVSETTRRPYAEFNFQHRVADVITAAGITDKRYGDLRRSAVVRLAEAGCTIPQIASITGHSYARCEAILEVYLPRTTALARQAIANLLTARAKA